jgi:formate transporter
MRAPDFGIDAYAPAGVAHRIATVGAAKAHLDAATMFALAALALGVFCNALVCLAGWLCYSARTTRDKILAIAPPITGMVAMRFEQSIANMYFTLLELLVRNHLPVLHAAGQSLEQLADPTRTAFLVGNLLSVTRGSLFGGTVMVAGVYWFVYLRQGTFGGKGYV